MYSYSVFFYTGMEVVKIGGPVYRIGVGGGAASSIQVRLNFSQRLSQDLENGCPKLAIVTFWGVLFFKGDHSKL